MTDFSWLVSCLGLEMVGAHGKPLSSTNRMVL
jgi:hypothetical protein